MLENNKMSFLIKRWHLVVILIGLGLFVSSLAFAVLWKLFLVQKLDKKALMLWVEIGSIWGFYLLIGGASLVVLNKESGSLKFRGFHKLLVIGFFIASISFIFLPPFLDILSLQKLFIIIGGGMFLSAIFGQWTGRL